ncbi:hypothetical protein EfmJHP35_15890 [Enterococcus faecium]|nr:hypothetical protein EfmJHP35_15890 [Enterococcus faecium]
MTHDEAKAYQDELEDEINRQRIEAGKRPFTLDLEKEVKLKERKISKADPESGYYVKGEREKQFAYSAHTSCDDNGFILSTIITPGNIHDSQVAFQLVKQSKRLFPEINCVVADAGYKTPKFVHFLTHLNLRPCWGSWTTASCFMVNDWIFQDIVDHNHDSNWRRNRFLFETVRNS